MLRAEDVDSVARAVAALRAGPVVLGVTPVPEVGGRLGVVLLRAQAQLRGS